LIGDPALRIDPRQAPHAALDLVRVAAPDGVAHGLRVWAAPREVITAEIEQAFQDSARYGVEHLEDIVACESQPGGSVRNSCAST
jgi:hypothetical protein